MIYSAAAGLEMETKTNLKLVSVSVLLLSHELLDQNKHSTAIVLVCTFSGSNFCTSTWKM
eukprot:scaffold8238_cov75-Skeletonema_marinoi.AAC.2